MIKSTRLWNDLKDDLLVGACIDVEVTCLAKNETRGGHRPKLYVITCRVMLHLAYGRGSWKYWMLCEVPRYGRRGGHRKCEGNEGTVDSFDKRNLFSFGQQSLCKLHHQGAERSIWLLLCKTREKWHFIRVRDPYVTTCSKNRSM